MNLFDLICEILAWLIIIVGTVGLVFNIYYLCVTPQDQIKKDNE